MYNSGKSSLVSKELLSRKASMFKKWSLKAILKEVLVGAFLIFIFSNIISYLRKPNLDTSLLPKFSQKLIDTQNFVYEKEKPLLVHFWAIWCPTCKLEASNIERLSKKYNVLSIAVTSGSDETLHAYMQENSLTFKVINDQEGHLSKQFKVKAFPTSFIYDRNRELAFTEVGYTTTAGLFARMLLLE